MPELHVVLISPEIPQNTGNIARTCAATGARLHLVRPLGFRLDEKQLLRAGLDYWHLLGVTVYDSLDDFFARCSGPFFYFSTKGRRVYSEVSYPETCWLVFGRETAGLPEELLLRNPQTTVRLPMIGESRSLNLSNAVAVGVYETLRQWGFPQLKESGELTRYRWGPE
ncbi:MAG: tRNA (cytidine(34)-2'-O)-methyltransferase [Clostridia bacterium]|nr:tRNA (cytidine(34)-2'-O)-methyltransferase [Clostridia bacterium]